MIPTIISPDTCGLIAHDRALPLTKVEIDGEIVGLLQHTRISQSFFNDHAMPLEAVYIHPLPPQAAVHGFQIKIGERVIDGSVKERGRARREYAEAVQSGHRAALLEEERPDIFTTTVGNIGPGEVVTVTFEMSGPLELLEETASLCLPLVVPEVYIPGKALGGGNVGPGVVSDTDSVPDASRITPPRLPAETGSPVELHLSYLIDPLDLEIDQVDSLCHFARIESDEEGCYLVSLLPGVEQMDRDFVLRMKLRRGRLQTTLVTDPTTKTFALTVVPPRNVSEKRAPKDIVLVLDRSGSMGGGSMAVARSAVGGIVDSLTPEDHFLVIAFDCTVEMSDLSLVPASLKNKERAFTFLRGIEARGGTEAKPALLKAIDLLEKRDGVEKAVVFITDGAVGNDRELRSVSNIRINTVGIGQNASSGVLLGIANATGGLHYSIPDLSALADTLHTMHKRIGSPYWTDLKLQGAQVSETAPQKWNVWEGVPATFFGKHSEVDDELVVSGILSDGEWHQEPVHLHVRESSTIYRSWARARLQELDTLWSLGQAEAWKIIKLSVEAQVLCRFTAFSAVDATEIVVDSHLRRTVVQPVKPTLQWRSEEIEHTVKDISAQDFGNMHFEDDEPECVVTFPVPVRALMSLYIVTGARKGASRILFSLSRHSISIETESGWEELFQIGQNRFNFLWSELVSLPRTCYLADVDHMTYRVEVQKSESDEDDIILILSPFWESVVESVREVRGADGPQRVAVAEKLEAELTEFTDMLKDPEYHYYRAESTALLLVEEARAVLAELRNDPVADPVYERFEKIASLAKQIRLAFELLTEARRKSDEILIKPLASMVKVELKRDWETCLLECPPEKFLQAVEYLAGDYKFLEKLGNDILALVVQPVEYENGRGAKVRICELTPTLQRDLMPLNSASPEDKSKILYQILQKFTEQTTLLPETHPAKRLPEDLKSAIEKFETSGDLADAFCDVERIYGVVVA